MNDNEVGKQIDQMVRFIKQEAEEKANEIAISAEEEFNIAKLQMLENEKQKIRKEYERREGQITVKRKIEASKQLNESRLRVLQAREGVLDGLTKAARDQMAAVTKDKAAYSALLANLLVQALYKLSEPKCVVKCRKVDLPLVKEVLEPAKKKYAQEYGQGTPLLSIDERDFLPPPPTGDDEVESCIGGIAVTSDDGKIVCSNTLDDRLRIAYQANLPRVREVLFGKVVRA